MSEPGARADLPAPLLNGVGAALLLATAAWLWLGASDIDGAGGGIVGPDGFPRVVAALLGGSSLLLLGSSAWEVLRSAPVPRVHVRRPFAVVGAVLLVCAYPLLLTWWGYYPATAVWLAPMLLLAGMRHPAGIAAGTAGFLLFTRLLFQAVLGTPLP